MNAAPPPPQHPNTCTLCLVRHGETPWNTESRLQGHIDIPLNETGIAQARAARASLAGVRFGAAYSSDLERARRTAEEIVADPTAIVLTPQLRERHYGAFQGLTYAEAESRHPEAYQRFKRRDPDFAFPEGGESLRAFAARIAGMLNEIAARHAGEHVLVVTHGGVLDIAHRIAAGKPLEAARDFTIPNASLNWIGHDGRGWQLISWGDTRHTGGARDELAHA